MIGVVNDPAGGEVMIVGMLFMLEILVWAVGYLLNCTLVRIARAIEEKKP
jgi:hypothetical protein